MSSDLEPLIFGTIAGALTGGLGFGAGLGLNAATGLGAVGGGLLGSSLGSSSSQAKVDRATINANREEAKLAAAEAALSNAQNFRRNLSSQLALASFRGGPGSSIASQIGSESVGNFYRDQGAIERGARGVDSSANLQIAGANSARAARNINAIGQFGMQAFQNSNLSKSENKTVTKKGGG